MTADPHDSQARGDHRERNSGPGDRSPGEVLTDQEREWIRRSVHALPPATESDIDGWCDVILNARHRTEQRATEQRPTER